MNRTNYLKLIGIGLIFTLSLLMFVFIYAQTLPNRDAPIAKQGVLDLSGWDFHKQGLVSLDGEWEFYKEKLLAPADFSHGSRTDVSYLAVPSTWKGKTAEGGMTRKGFGTYRLKVILPAGDEIYGLKTKSIRMSHQLYIDGKLEGESGRPATTKDAHEPGNTPYTTFFQPKEREMEIIIPVANHMFSTGGIINGIDFGLDTDIANASTFQLGSDVAFLITLAIMSAYHLSFYFMRRREKSYLYSGMYLTTLLMYQSVYGEKVLLRLVPSIPFTYAYKLQDITVFAGIAMLMLFFCSIDDRILTRRRMMQLLTPLYVYLAAVIVLPYSTYTEVKGPLLIYEQLVHFYVMGRLLYLNSKKQSTTTRKELVAYIGCSISLTVYLIDGMLYAQSLVPTELAGKIGVLYFITFMNMLLAVRFTNAYQKTEILSHQLAISNELKDEFLKHTSHEMKTPLHGIQNITSHLLEDEEMTLSPKQKQNLWLIKDTSIKLSMLIHDLIDVTRLKHGQLRLHSTVVDVKVVTQIVFDVLQFELLGKDVILDNQVPAHIWVHADENRLRQIMYNLVHNAIKHTDKGSIKVTAKIKEDKVYISVEDTGTGITGDQHAAIFEYFEQMDELLPQDGYTGMGVGLYISRKLVEQMQGEIWVDYSEVGKGTRMMFTLPSADVSAAHREIASASMDQPRMNSDIVPLDRIGQHAYTIMIVDDEASNIHVLLNILKNHPYNVITAFSAKEAMAKMREHRQVDLVILDVMMPETSGIELCQMLRAHHSILDLPILFATVKDTPHDIALGYRAGANDYVTKPFDAETLIARIQTLLAMKTSIQEAIRNEQAFHHAQIKPHFLYNALSSVISFCYLDGEKAAHLLTMLSQYLRYILDMDKTTLIVPLHQEMELIEAYVEIEKVRFGGRFHFACHADESVFHTAIPSLSIQPFVENAIRHGLFEKDGEGTVTLTIHEKDHYLEVIIEDDGIGIPEDLLYQITKGDQRHGGIAIRNIRKRLDSIPGSALSISSEIGRGTTVTMLLPMPMEDQIGLAVEGRAGVV